MLDVLLETLKNARKREVSVGYVTGELLDEWQRLTYEKTILHHEFEAIKAAFALEFLKRIAVDGKFTMDETTATKEVNKAFFEECKDFISDARKRETELFELNQRLWQETYHQLNISPAGHYRINTRTGEVFEIVIDDTDGDDHAQTNSIH